MYIFGIVGLIVISIAVWIKKERNQDVLFVIGGLFLLGYSIALRDKIFIILQLVFILSSAVELLKIKRRK